jgi:hypothetical protein
MLRAAERRKLEQAELAKATRVSRGLGWPQEAILSSLNSRLALAAALAVPVIAAGVVRSRSKPAMKSKETGMAGDRIEPHGVTGKRLAPDLYTDQSHTDESSPLEPLLESTAGLVILKSISGGCSKCPVFAATFDGAHAVAKIMRTFGPEFKAVRELQGPYVARVVYESPANLHAYPVDANERPVDGESGDMLVGMEKLAPAGLYPTYTQGTDDLIDTAYTSMTDRQFDVVSLSTLRRQHLTELLRAVVSLTDMGMLWGDLKEENLGIDSDGHLRIFDFGEVKRVSESNRALDIVAYGKLLYNTLVQKLAFHPGRHYLGNGRGSLDSAALVASVDRFSGATPLAGALRGCFRLGFQGSPVDGVGSSTNDQVQSVILSFFKALEMKTPLDP